MGIIPNKYGIGMPHMFAQNGCLVHIYLDGSVLISHGGVEMGQGLHTKMLQVVSTELGIPMSRIRVADTSNDKVPNAIPTGGSTAADLNGNALRNACQQLMAFGSRVNLKGHRGATVLQRGQRLLRNQGGGQGRQTGCWTEWDLQLAS